MADLTPCGHEGCPANTCACGNCVCWVRGTPPTEPPWTCRECGQKTRAGTIHLHDKPDSEALLDEMTSIVIDATCDLADRDPGQAAWDDLRSDLEHLLPWVERREAAAARKALLDAAEQFHALRGADMHMDIRRVYISPERAGAFADWLDYRVERKPR